MKIFTGLWDKKHLVWNFAVTDLQIRYRSSVLGFFWTILEPLLMLAVLYVVFTSIIPTRIENFGLYLLIGIVMWGMISRGTEMGLNSMISKSGLMTQIYFPREIPALSSSITSLLMLGFELIVFIVFMIVFQFVPSFTIVFFPLVLILEFILLFFLNLALSVLNVLYRDIQFIWRVVIHAGFFLTPIFYSFDILPQQLQDVLKYSPMVQIVNMGHDLVIFGKIPSLESILIAIFSVAILSAISYLIFRKLEQRAIEGV